jgi:glycosyltransferase involved in cell wall biosynthesis
MREKLTVLIPCKNEAHNIAECIASVRDVADEILIADSLSTDDTLEIVRQAGGYRVIEREFVGYADFKNWAIPQAAHPWVLIVDADERLTPELHADIKRVLSTPAENIDAYAMPRRNFFIGQEIKHSTWGAHDVVRMLRRDVVRYKNVRVHESLEVPAERVQRLAGSMLHYSFTSYGQYLTKCNHYAELLARESYDRGRRAHWFGLVVAPWLKFFQAYVLQRGFLDGKAGFQVAMLSAIWGPYLKYARLWELEQQEGLKVATNKPVEQKRLAA